MHVPTDLLICGIAGLYLAAGLYAILLPRWRIQEPPSRNSRRRVNS